ncbi:unnamed protein product [Echinostoma caproni]|uniref:DC_STAMP domain-containing protein n=1 Tax=Echinostoma caproni TaxID=27848 RepID=A0A183ARB5_9TREM|nr:unnamed protein product [Echinostoma caproni]
MKSERIAQMAEAYMKPKSDTANADPVDQQVHQRQNMLAKMTDKMREQEFNNTKRLAEKSKHKIKSLLTQLGSNDSMLSSFSRKIESGAKIELMMKRRLTATCMVFHNIRGKMCFESSVKACHRLQNVLSWTFGLPILIKHRCIGLIAQGAACPNSEAIDAAVKDCGGSVSKFGIGAGFGAMFFQATESITELGAAFAMELQMPKLKPPKMVSWVKEKKSTMKAVMRHTRETLTMLLRISMIASVLLKLLALLVFRQASKYITNYLIDSEFDNLYVDTAFEAIDAKRRSEGRETILPLKDFEKKKVFWRRKGYTKAEFTKAFMTIIKVLGIGIALSAFFLIDAFMADTIGMLDAATAGEIKVGKGSSTSHQAAPTDPGVNVQGDGIFYHMIKKTTDVLGKISKIHLNIRLSLCSPNVQYTDPYYFTRFILIWVFMLLVALSSGYLLRVRHVILNFFYPRRRRRRAITLYNRLLVDRRRHMTVCRNLIVHQARQGHLQAEAQEISGEKMLHNISPFLAKLLGHDRVKCLLCLNSVRLGRGVFVCPYDDTSVCMACMTVLFQGHRTCITCLDRNPQQLFRIQRKIRDIKQSVITNID